jgi:hypothetical protein
MRGLYQNTKAVAGNLAQQADTLERKNECARGCLGRSLCCPVFGRIRFSVCSSHYRCVPVPHPRRLPHPPHRSPRPIRRERRRLPGQVTRSVSSCGVPRLF